VTPPQERTNGLESGVIRAERRHPPLIPKLGLRQLLVSRLEDRAVGRRKPVQVSLLGEDICLSEAPRQRRRDPTCARTAARA